MEGLESDEKGDLCKTDKTKSNSKGDLTGGTMCMTLWSKAHTKECTAIGFWKVLQWSYSRPVSYQYWSDKWSTSGENLSHNIIRPSTATPKDPWLWQRDYPVSNLKGDKHWPRPFSTGCRDIRDTNYRVLLSHANRILGCRSLEWNCSKWAASKRGNHIM